MRSGLAVAEIALSLVLLAGAGLLALGRLVAARLIPVLAGVVTIAAMLVLVVAVDMARAYRLLTTPNARESWEGHCYQEDALLHPQPTRHPGPLIEIPNPQLTAHPALDVPAFHGKEIPSLHREVQARVGEGIQPQGSCGPGRSPGASLAIHRHRSVGVHVEGGPDPRVLHPQGREKDRGVGQIEPARGLEIQPATYTRREPGSQHSLEPTPAG